MLQILILYSTDTDLADKDAVIEWLTARVAEQEHTTRVLHRIPPTPGPGIFGMLPTSHPVTSLHILMPVSRTDLPLLLLTHCCMLLPFQFTYTQ